MIFDQMFHHLSVQVRKRLGGELLKEDVFLLAVVGPVSVRPEEVHPCKDQTRIHPADRLHFL